MLQLYTVQLRFGILNAIIKPEYKLKKTINLQLSKYTINILNLPYLANVININVVTVETFLGER